MATTNMLVVHDVIRQARRGLFRELAITQPLLILVREGEKLVHVDGQDYRALSGEVMALSAPALATVTNIPGPSGSYRAEVFALQPDFVGTAHQGARNGATASPQLLAALEAGRLAIKDFALPEAVQRHRLGEVLLWLEDAGIGLRAERQLTLPQLLRTMFALDLAQPWSTGKVLQQLASQGEAMSAATLRRRLHDDSTNLQAILTDARMTHALHLLQATTHPISHIAAQVGYDSASRFAVRFRKRFGLSPSSLRDDRQLLSASARKLSKPAQRGKTVSV